MDTSYLHQTKCIFNTHRHPLSVLSRLSISKHHHHNNININNNINARRSLRLGARNMCMASSSDTLVSGKSSSPTVASKKDTDVDEHEDLKSWMHKNGLPPCKVVLKDRVAYDSRHPPIHYVAASEDLQAGDTVFWVPDSLVVTLERVLGNETVAELLTTNKLSELACLALYLMYEKKQGKESVWYPYIRELDRQRGRGQLAVESPLLWSESELDYLTGSPIKDEVLERAEGIRKEYNELDTVWFMAGSLFQQYPFDIPTEAFSFEIFKQAFVAVQSCVVHLQNVSLARRFALVPLGPPLLTYRSNCKAMLTAVDGGVQLVVDRPYLAGQSIVVWCGPQPNSKLLINYGFVDEDNPYDRVVVEAALNTEDPQYQDKRLAAQRNGRLTIQPFQVKVGKERETVLDMLPYMRLGYVTDPLEMESVLSSQGPVCPVSPCMEYAVLDQLATYFRERLAGYLTTLSEDDALYGETPLHLAAKNGCNEAAGLLLSHGAFVEATANKDELDPLLVAAHFPKRIKKQLVDKMNICYSVDKILVDKFPVVTYRVLAYYLIGVTRIYSKKVEYLLVDCNHSLNEMKFFSEGRRKVDVNYGGTCLPESSSQRSQLKAVDVNSSESSRKKNSYSFLESMRAQFTSLSMPDNFDLDAYDLEIVEDDSSSNDHVRPHLELVLADACESHRTMRHTFGKDHASASTSEMVTNNNPETSVEKFRHRFVLEECLDPMVLGESDEELVLDSVPLTEQGQRQEQELEWNNDTVCTDMMSEGVQNPDKHPDEECTTTGQTVVSEMTSVDNIMLKPTPNKSHLSVTIDVTPQSKAPVVLGERKSERVAVRTPASREHVRPPRKRKCVFDYAIVIPNEVYETWVSEASDLLRKRRTCTDVLDRKERRSFDDFMQPQIPINAGFPLELRSVISANKPVMAEEVEDTVGPTPLNVLKSSWATEDEVIAPATPATHPTPLRFDEVLETSMVNPMRPTSSYESGERAMFPIAGVDEDLMHRDEGPSSLGEDNQDNVLVAEKLSAVTKSVGGYLHRNILQRKEKGAEEVVNLSQLLKHKTKKEAARFFYQMLVLKTGGYIDVKQEKAYDEIFVRQTQKLKEAFGGGSRE